MVRLTPRIAPYVPKPRNVSPSHLIHQAPRAILTGNFPRPRVTSLRAPISGSRPAAVVKPALSNLTSGTHNGKPPKANPKPKTPAQQTGVSTRPRTTTRLPSSAKAQQPGVHTLQGAKMKVHKLSPLKLPNLH